MSVIPFGIAFYLAKHPNAVHLGTNHGTLITPPIVTAPDQFSGFDQFSAEHLKELQGHWVLISLLPNESCDTNCQQGLYKTQQITLMMGKDIARIRRLALINRHFKLPMGDPWASDLRLLKAIPNESLQLSLRRLLQIESGVLLVMDPLGNLMMHYSAGYDPYQVRDDLSKLLRISQIG